MSKDYFELPVIKYSKAYDDIIIKQLKEWIWDSIFKQSFELLKNNQVENAQNALEQAIKQNRIYYTNGAFYSASGRFSNTIAKELELLGARYNKNRNAYVLENLPTNLAWVVETTKAVTTTKAEAVMSYLTNQLGQLSKIEKRIAIEGLVEKIMLNLQERVYKNAQSRKIELITPKLTSFQTDEIAKRYVDNLEFWITNFETEKIPEMRKGILDLTLQGKGLPQIEQYLQKEWHISQDRIKFLARNESAIATSSYLSSKYQNEGFTHFKWNTILDGRERKLHKELNGQIFRFDNLPIIDERTGQRGLPAETYNCRCSLTPIANKEFLQRRKELFKANNSLGRKLKRLLNKKVF